jgi:glycosyltransferase involved in cell wall biosynthesis
MERLIVNLAKEIDRNKFEISVCLLEPFRDTFFERELKRIGIPLFSLNSKNIPNPIIFFRLLKLLNNLRPHIVHTHLKAVRYSFLPRVLAGIPVHIHTMHALAKIDTKKTKDRFVNRLIFRYGNVKVVSVSREVARSVKAVYGVDSEVIYNGVEIEEFSNNLKRESDFVNILNIASFKREKNISLLIDAFSGAIAQEKKIKLILVGDGAQKNLLEQQIQKKGIREWVTLLGWRSDIPEILANCDIFLLTSDSEGFPMVLVEAMASGKPVTATSVGGVPEIVENGVTGFLVAPGDSHALSEAILKLARDDKLREGMGKRGREKAEKEFNMRTVALKYERLYEKLLLGGRTFLMD